MKRMLIIALLLVTVATVAQTDRVYMKNGSLLRGELLQIDARHLSIDIGEAAPLKLSLEQLSAIRVKKKKSALPAKALLAVDSLNRVLKTNQWLHQVRLGLMNGEDGSTFSTATSFTGDYTLFYSVKATWKVGVGIGYDDYPSFEVIPVGVEVRKDWGIGPSPFFSYVRAGFSRAGYRNDFGGFNANVRGQEFIALGLGQQWPVGKSAMFISMGFRSQSLRTSWFNRDFSSSTDWNLNRLDIKVGMVF